MEASKGDHALPEEDQEISTAVNLDDEQPEDDDDANSETTMFSIPRLSLQGNWDNVS